MNSIDISEKFDNIGTRINEIKSHFTFNLFENVCQGLLEDDRLLFAFLLAKNALQVKEDEFMKFLKVSALKFNNRSEENQKINLEKAVQMLEDQESFPKLDFNLTSFFESSNPFNDPTLERFSAFQRLIVIRILRQDQLIYAIEAFVHEVLGAKFIEQGHFDLYKCFEDSTNLTPLLFVMTTEMDDPIEKIFQIANAFKFDPEKVSIHSISDAGAEGIIKVIEANLKTAHWIVIENIHASWAGFNAVATFVEQMTPESAHPDFRLWISAPTNTLPINIAKSLLQRSMKMIDTPKDGLRGLVRKGLKSEFPSKTRLIEASPQKLLLQNFIPALCLFHGVVQKRHKFSPRGWSFDYDFNESDLQLSFNVLNDILNTPKNEHQLENAIYSIGKSIYGGLIADPMDRKVLQELVEEFLNPETLESSKTKGIIDGLSRHTDTNVLGIHPSLVLDVNYKKMEENVQKILNIQDRKDLVEVRVN